MKKILLLLVLVMTAGAVNAKTDKSYASFGTPSGATYSDNKFTWTATSGQYMEMFTFSAGDLSKYAELRLKATKTGASEIHYRIQFRASSGSDSKNVTNRYETSDTELVIDLSTIANIDYMTKIILFCDNSEKGSITIKQSEVYLETAEYENMEVTTPIQELYWYDYSTGDAYDRTASALRKQLNTTVAGNNQIIYGPYSANDYTAYMNVTGYDNALFNLNTAGTPGIRLMYNGSTLTIDTDGTKTSYTQSLSTMPKIGTIKTKNGSGDVNFNIASINFGKNFKATSETTFNIAASSASTVAYDRTFVSDRMSTVCLPFALTTSETSAAGKFYELIKVDDKGLHFTEVTETEAYKPYVFNPTAATPFASLTNKAIVATPASESDYAITVDNYTFQGVLAHQSLPSGVYGYNAANGDFSKTTSDKVTIDAFRAYITGPSLARSLNCIFSDDETTGIQTLSSIEKENGAIYNLAGQRVSANHKGIVIHNGKKVIVK